MSVIEFNLPSMSVLFSASFKVFGWHTHGRRLHPCVCANQKLLLKQRRGCENGGVEMTSGTVSEGRG